MENKMGGGGEILCIPPAELITGATNLVDCTILPRICVVLSGCPGAFSVSCDIVSCCPTQVIAFLQDIV